MFRLQAMVWFMILLPIHFLKHGKVLLHKTVKFLLILLLNALLIYIQLLFVLENFH